VAGAVRNARCSVVRQVEAAGARTLRHKESERSCRLGTQTFPLFFFFSPDFSLFSPDFY
jgi:hypothetical protein